MQGQDSSALRAAIARDNIGMNRDLKGYPVFALVEGFVLGLR
jgi:hypothetical protein